MKLILMDQEINVVTSKPYIRPRCVLHITLFPSNSKKVIVSGWRKNDSSSSWIFLEITCWYWLLGFCWI